MHCVLLHVCENSWNWFRCSGACYKTIMQLLIHQFTKQIKSLVFHVRWKRNRKKQLFFSDCCFIDFMSHLIYIYTYNIQIQSLFFHWFDKLHYTIPKYGVYHYHAVHEFETRDKFCLWNAVAQFVLVYFVGWASQ